MQWINLTVGEYCPFVYGKAIKKQEQYEQGIPVFGSNGVYTYSKNELVKPYAVIIGRKGTVGKVHLSPEPCWVSDTAFYIQYDSIDEARFTYYLLSTLGLEDMNTDAAVPGLNRNNAHRLEVSVPETPEQRQSLIEPLVVLDKKIELNRQINQTLEAMAQAIFKSWFVDFEPVKAKIAVLENGGTEDDANLAAMQAISGKTADQLATLKTQHPDQYQQLHHTASLFPTAMQDSEMGNIPAGWKVKKIGDVLKRLKPKKRYTKKEVETFGKVPVYEQGNSILLGFHNNEPGFHASASDPIFIFGDHTCITHLSCSAFDISQNVIPLKGKILPTIWTYFAINGKQVFQEYRRHWSELIVREIATPNVNLAKTYSKIVADNYSLIECNNKESKTLEQLRDTLLPKLLSGELQISTEDAV